MSTACNEGDRIAMSQRERDRLRVLHSVLEGQRPQVEAARLLCLTPRHVRRLLQRQQQGGDAALIHGLRGQPSNHRKDAKLRRRVLQLDRKDYADFGPTFAAEKLRNAACRCPPIPCGAGCSPKVSGSDSADAISTAADGHAAPASANWSRWTRRFTTGRRGAARTWFCDT
jgi:hypothetical protein